MNESFLEARHQLPRQKNRANDDFLYRLQSGRCNVSHGRYYLSDETGRHLCSIIIPAAPEQAPKFGAKGQPKQGWSIPTQVEHLTHTKLRRIHKYLWVMVTVTRLFSINGANAQRKSCNNGVGMSTFTHTEACHILPPPKKSTILRSTSSKGYQIRVNKGHYDLRQRHSSTFACLAHASSLWYA